eukprot:Sspe_Gene.44986::Locus_22142_Transcript_2_2_Confidence_0.600_Length_344::g.44986::m.44986
MAKWIVEDLEPGLRFSYKLNHILASTQSKFQQVDVCDTESFGRVLIIDGLIQSAQLDEYVYHECLVHPALGRVRLPRVPGIEWVQKGSLYLPGAPCPAGPPQ